MKRVLIAAFFLSVPAFGLGYSRAVIKGFHMRMCSSEWCTEVQSPEALQGQWGLITLPEVQVKRVSGKKVQTFKGRDAIYDVGAQTLAIRQVTLGPAKDLLIDLSSGQISLF